VTADDERVQLTHRHVESTTAPARFEEFRRNLPGRGSAVAGTVAAAADTLELTLTATIYVDGLTRQGFVAAFNEIIAAADRAIGGPAPQMRPAPTTAPRIAAAADADTAEHPPAVAATAAPGDSAPTMVMSSVWLPTHRVPPGGLRAWGQPDPATEPVATLQARVELSIAEMRGDWARVIGSNGWTGWVDSRRLETMAPGTSRSGAAATATGSFPVGILGAIALSVAAFLPWFDSGGFTADSFDVALPFLWDLEASGDPKLGIAVLALGVLGLLPILLKGVPDTVRRVAALGGIAVAALFVLQVHRGVDSTFADTIEVLGYGVYVALAGAVVMLIAPRGSITNS
jgi:drug/metabolite transporter superfamily protein YnfA